jgi:hypothetical protein
MSAIVGAFDLGRIYLPPIVVFERFCTEKCGKELG